MVSSDWFSTVSAAEAVWRPRMFANLKSAMQAEPAVHDRDGADALVWSLTDKRPTVHRGTQYRGYSGQEAECRGPAALRRESTLTLCLAGGDTAYL